MLPSAWGNIRRLITAPRKLQGIQFQMPPDPSTYTITILFLQLQHHSLGYVFFGFVEVGVRLRHRSGTSHGKMMSIQQRVVGWCVQRIWSISVNLKYNLRLIWQMSAFMWLNNVTFNNHWSLHVGPARNTHPSLHKVHGAIYMLAALEAQKWCQLEPSTHRLVSTC